ncbi:MAG: DUF1566 domain-containing protein [Proteobacteria bacterium]|nr:DUF1566 domain-containing protein [Pseudomonadota bacterium]
MICSLTRLLVLALCCTLAPLAALAQPQGAFDACKGKQADDSCTVGRGEAGVCVEHGVGTFCVPRSHMQGGRPGGSQGGNQGDMQGPPPDMQGGSTQNQSTGMSQQQRPKKASYPTGSSYAKYIEHTPTHTGGAFDTGQEYCFDSSKVISCPEPGDAYYGQDAQYAGIARSYTDHGDGSVSDNNTGLTWEKAHHEERIRQVDAVKYCNGLNLGGHDDWRLPSIKELYSIVTFDGAQGLKAYLDTKYFDIAPPASLDANDRFASTHSPQMMGQTTSSTIYKGNLWGRGQESSFFMNFLDGRIKCAPTGGGMGQLYRCVRGPEYGRNDFMDNGDGTVTDRTTGFDWQQADDGQTRDWPEALAYCEDLTLAGHDDWRLPNAKELQYILDYTRIPATPKEFTQTDPAGWYWTSTTLGDSISQAIYICFGKGIASDGTDVHGAGAQRSDPKTTAQKRSGQQGGQQDDVRVDNLVRCVRN